VSADLRQNVLNILRGNSFTKDAEALTLFAIADFEDAEAQEQLRRAKAFVAAETAKANAPATTAPATTEVAAAGAEAGGESAPQATPEPQAEFVDPLPEVPAAMKAKQQWVRWRNKIPYQVNGANASSTDPTTWVDYRAAVTGATINREQGVGFMFADGFAGIDLDGCRNPETEEIKPWAQEIIDSLEDAYVEISPSGTGIHIIVLGAVPGNDRKFNLNPAIGFGKAAIEIYDSARYFTVTGNSYFEDAGDVVPCDLTKVYQMFHELRAANPLPRNEKAEAADAVDAGKPTQITWHGLFRCSKYDIFKTGTILSQSNPFKITNGIGTLEYPSQSEADMAFATVLACMHEDDADRIWDEYTKSSMVRDKWLKRESYFRDHTIATAIDSAKNVKAKPAVPVHTVASAVSAAPVLGDDLVVPPFDPSVVNGIYKRFVEVATAGTTLAPQFVYAIAKTIVGARIAGKVFFEGLDVEPRYYTALIGETGSGKGEAWRRVFQILTMDAQIGNMAALKIINSADSGAGIRDTFFEQPQDAPVLMYVDEVAGLGNKGAATKQPEIIDKLIELADSTQISSVKAASKGNKAVKTKNDARLCAVLCGQDGSTYMKAFAGKTQLGMYDRLSPEYGEAVDAGDLPRVIVGDAMKVMAELNGLNFSGELKMALDARGRLEQFWGEQPPGVKKKARWKKALWLDAYMSAFGRGSRVADLEDVEIAIRIFTRQLLIRQVHFTDEVPDRTGYYLGAIKKITEAMRRKLKAGGHPALVALSRRDYERQTNAARDNEEHIFERAWNIHSKTHLTLVEIEKTNGRKYPKYLPIEDEED
jgi:hypothetical protein